ncbi:hypothetical protein LZZ85_26820 [Terrimonas sp. NA20]|uniref:Uncharacterized protein n=1 Tax=Terrimonas ginsenosidimutans TaxID=2908004 RepID=A0ABS9L050_9BACT|nr:hypothetical protein [Terrimonas ginsenosidimutans]MCG2617944.1 hypothetical protein [Terrimonas ginsenosidimutans]
MKHTAKRFKAAILLFSLMTIVFACKKGDEGPAGEPGTANVIFSPWMKTTSWIPSTTSTGSGKSTFYFDINAPQVTQGIIDSGTVIVYMKFVNDPDGTGIAKPLPSVYYNLGGASTQYRFQHGLMLSKVRVIADVIPSGTPANSNDVRYIIIPGGVPLTGRMDMSYEAVCERYGIPK